MITADEARGLAIAQSSVEPSGNPELLRMAESAIRQALPYGGSHTQLDVWPEQIEELRRTVAPYGYRVTCAGPVAWGQRATAIISWGPQ